MNIKQYTIGMIFLIMTVLFASAGVALDFTVNCPASVQSGASFDCTISAPQTLKGASFTLNTGSAQVTGVTLVGTDASLLPTYGFFMISGTHPANTPFATVHLQTTSGFTFQVNGIRATLGDNTVLATAQMIFPPRSVSLTAPPVCTPESDPVFCSHLGKNCGTVTGDDNCGTSRTVNSCGTCTSPATCGGAGVANVCGQAPPAAADSVGTQVDNLLTSRGLNPTAPVRGSWTASLVSSLANLFRNLFG